MCVRESNSECCSFGATPFVLLRLRWEVCLVVELVSLKRPRARGEACGSVGRGARAVRHVWARRGPDRRTRTG